MNVIATLLLAATGRTPSPAFFTFFEPVQPPRTVQVIAHRGAMTVAPENTKPALEASIADGVEWVEVDVRLTRDGHHVLFHDETLADKTDLTGPVAQQTLDDLQKADAGAKFARRFAGQKLLTLEAALALSKNRVNLYLDCKQVDADRLAREIHAAEMGSQVVVYGSPQLLQAVRAAGSEKIALMTKWRPQFGFDKWIDDVKPQAVEIDAVDVTAEACRAFHGHGIKVEAKVLGEYDKPEVWERMAAAGVDWLQTDRAEEIIARRALQAAGADRVKIGHHRGSSRYAPENTLAALNKAAALGADFVEFDVRTTRDGGFVLLHDGSLDRTTSGRGPAKDHALAEICALDAGSWFGRSYAAARVPTLDEFLAAAKPTGVGLYVDAKDIAPDALAAALERHDLTERAVVYQSAAYLEKLKTIAPGLRRMPPLRDPSQLDDVAARVEPYAFDTDWRILSKALIDRCHAKGVKVFSDALGAHETVPHYRQAIRDGIDLIQTDHPLRVLRAIELEAAAAGAR